MTDDEFWQLIDTTRPAEPDCDAHADALVEALSSFEPAEIVSFDEHFTRAHAALYTWDLWGVAYIVLGGCSDDAFMDFRGAVIGRGREAWHLARDDPRAFGDSLAAGDDEALSCEMLLYAAAQAYESVTGEQLPGKEFVPPTSPLGDEWEEERVDDLFPDLAARFGGDSEGRTLDADAFVVPITDHDLRTSARLVRQAGGDPAMVAHENKRIVERFWEALYERDWDRIAAFFAEDGEYTDVPSPEDDVARGPAQIVARLRLGLEPIDGYEHHLRTMVADGDVVVTEHAETWRWRTGEEVTLPFVSVHELRDGLITRWWDYWDLQTLMNAAPAWWIEHIMAGYQ